MILERLEKDDVLFEEDGPRMSLISPRIILIGDGNVFPLVEYRNTRWLGLPGGKVKGKECPEGENMLSFGAFLTIVREVREKCGIDLSGYLEQIACLGLAEINVVDNTARQVVTYQTPIFIGLVSELEFTNVNDRVHLVRIGEHLPGPLFPDARLALAHYEKNEVLKGKYFLNG
jgi:8-oxo-dGTP pyrophosphatase MutT (NUDIX family)